MADEITRTEFEWLKKRQNNVELRTSLLEGVIQQIKRVLPSSGSATITSIIERYEELVKEGEDQGLYEPEAAPEPEPPVEITEDPEPEV